MNASSGVSGSRIRDAIAGDDPVVLGEDRREPLSRHREREEIDAAPVMQERGATRIAAA